MNLKIMSNPVTAGLVATLVALAGAGASREGLNGVDKTQSAASLGKGRIQASLQAHVIDDNRLLENSVMTTNGKSEFTNHLLIANTHLALAYGLTDRWDASLTMPLYFEKFENASGSANGFAPGDLKVTLKYRTPWESEGNPWALSFLGGAYAMTSSRGKGAIPREIEYMPIEGKRINQGTRAFGSGKPEFFLTSALTADLRKLADPIPLQWHVNAGIRKVGFDAGKAREFDDAVALVTAVEYQPWKYAGVFGEFNHESGFKRILNSQGFKTEPTTATLGVTGESNFGLRLWTGMVFGLFREGSIPVEHRNADGKLLESFMLKGSVPVSMVFGLSWNFGMPEKKIAKIIDTDSDKDGIVDLLDKCPVAAEDKDGFDDQDGCPDPDNDKDGIADISDKCPELAQDALGENGCLAKDEDGDGIFGTADKCPTELETINGFQDEDGCTDKVIAKGEKLVLEGIYFKTASSELAPESSPTLERLTEQLKVLPDVKLEVQGHTDNNGNAASNKRLSLMRAESVVNYLTGKGIAAARLKSIGYGSETPVADNATDEGREKNRRVELRRMD